MNQQNPGQAQHANRLIEETSPYLLQHAYNPVDWYPWSEEALQKARDEDKPIFLSIGYSACHWCHVMEHESFENENIAQLMNESFVNIKVDREERPDLDDIYMNAIQAMTGQGGWPMSVFLSPELKPFYGGTYFPPNDMYGRPGFPSVLKSIAKAWQTERQKVENAANELTQHLQNVMRLEAGDHPLSLDISENGYRMLANRFDSQYGGFGSAPKFPHAMDIAFLLRYYHRTQTPDALQMAEFSLRKMAEGGMYDQLGGGFHRYSTDDQWLIPHFEKMLYDNALLAKTYTEAYQLTQNGFYERIVRETLDYILRDMTAAEGGFYSTLDADSEGQEGKFYAWTPQEIEQVLGDAQAAQMVCRYYGVEQKGNFEQGTSVLHVTMDAEALAGLFAVDLKTVQTTLADARQKLLEARAQRVHPGLDDKVLTDWNGLMISAMAFAGNALNEARYHKAAEAACDFIWHTMRKEGELLHTFREGRAHTKGFLSDYAFFVNGLLDTYEAGRDPQRIAQARELAGEMIERFWDDERGAFFYTAKDHEHLIAQSKDPMDNAIPSGNSMAVLALARLAEMTGETGYREKAEGVLQLFADSMRQIPVGFSYMLCGLEFCLDQPYEIVLSGPDAQSLDGYQRALFGRFVPNKVVLYADEAGRAALQPQAPIIEGKTPLDGAAAAYVCRQFTCSQPVSSPQDMLAQLG